MLSSNSTPSIGRINTASNGNVMACDSLVISFRDLVESLPDGD
jgi:hypothetical protein